MKLNNYINKEKVLKIKKMRLVASVVIFSTIIPTMSALLAVAYGKGNVFEVAIAIIVLALGTAYLLRAVYIL